MGRSVVGGLLATAFIGAFGAVANPAEDARRVPIQMNEYGPALIAVDPAGTPHIVYEDVAHHVRHAWLTEGSWEDEPVETGYSSVGGNGLAADSQGRLHLVLYVLEGMETETPTWVMAHAVRNGSGWTRTDVEEWGTTAALAIGPDDLPRMLFRREDGALVAGRFDGDAWILEETGLQGGASTLVFDAEGHAFALLRLPGPSASFATDASGTWTVVPYAVYSISVSLGLLASGEPHFVETYATSLPDDRIDHYWLEGEQWFEEFPGIVGKKDPEAYRMGPRLLVDGSDRLFATFSDTYIDGSRVRTRGRVAIRDRLGWRLFRLGRGYVQSTALAPDGALHAVLVEHDTLRYVRVAFPDLQPILDDLAVTPDGPGLTVEGTLRVVNQGARRSGPARVRFYLSDDGFLDDGDRPAGRAVRVGALAPGDLAEIPLALRIPGAASGSRLLAVISSARPDLDRFNDVAALSLGE